MTVQTISTLAKNDKFKINGSHLNRILQRTFADTES